MKCENIQKELEAYISCNIDESKRNEIQVHLDECQNCSRALRQLTRLSEVLQTWQGPEPSLMMYERLKKRIKAYESFYGSVFINPFVKKVSFRFVEVAAIVALTLFVSNWLWKPSPKIRDDSTTINFYLREHQGAVTQTINTERTPIPAARMRLNRDDILYYEFFNNRPEFTHPGIILRRPISQREISSQETPVISNGRNLTLSQARDVVNFDFVAQPRLHPGYILDNIKKIENRNSLHLLYTNGINTSSLFEQPLEGEGGLGAQDFREYAIYQSTGQAGGTILAWSDGTLSYVLIGNIEMSKLMEIAQSISARNKGE